MTRITFSGGYRHGDSVLWRISAGAKLLSFLLLVAAAVLADGISGFLLLSGVLGALILLSRMAVRDVSAPVLRLRLFLVLIVLFNFCFFSAEEPLFSLGMLHPSPEGLRQGLWVVFRMAAFLVLSTLLTVSTKPTEITDALADCFRPLSQIGFPAAQTAMILSAALGFLPVLAGETEEIRRAQTARGAQFEAKHFWQRAGAVLPLVIPVFLAAFSRADALALAMEARGCRTDGPMVPRRKKPFSRADFCCVLVSLAVLLAFIGLRVCT